MHTFRLRIVLILMAVTLVLYASVRAATTKVDATFASAALGPTVEVLEDPSGHMDFDAVRAASGFKPAPNLGTNFGFTRSAWWLRLTVTNADSVDRHVMLREDYPLIDYLDLWAPDHDGTWRHTATGDRTVFSTREFVHRDFCPRSRRGRFTCVAHPTGRWIWIWPCTMRTP